MSLKEYFVYMVRCSDGSYYIGVTNDYKRRVWEHNEGLHPKSYTFKRRPVKLVYVTEFSEVLEAIAYEKRLKGWSRKKKEALIAGDSERLSELSESQYAKRIRRIRKSTKSTCGAIMHNESVSP